MVPTATDSTNIMAVAADTPPMNTNTDIHSAPNECGMFNMKASLSPPTFRSRPPQAMAGTKMFISSRYSGNSHMAFLRCFSEEFSTTMT